MQEPVYHIPALLDECLEGLNILPNGTYVDVTFGGGGHSRGIIESLGEGGKLFSFDQDSDAEKNIIDDKRFTFVISFIRLLRAILENAHLVPHGPTPSLSSCPLLGACVWEGLGSGHKSLGFTHSQNSLLP